MNDKNNLLGTILTVLAVVGAVNWGLIGFFNFNLVDAIFGGGSAEQTSAVSRVIYALVGLAGLGTLFYLPRFMNQGRTGRATNDVAGVRA